MARKSETEKLLKRVSFLGRVSSVRDRDMFLQGMDLIMRSLLHPTEMRETLFASDNLLTWNRSYGFLRDPFFVDLLKDSKTTDTERGKIWRSYILDYFAQRAAHLNGDFLEVGCYTGHTPSILTKRIDFTGIGKKYFLFDLFEWNEGDRHYRLDRLIDGTLYEEVRARFKDDSSVVLVRGRVPDSFQGSLPEDIAFAHIDLNNAEAEAGAIREIYPRLTDGAIVIFDDYGWWTLSDQKSSVDDVLEPFGARILELPTGQGLLIKSKGYPGPSAKA